MFSCEYCEILKNNFFYRPPLVAPSELLYWIPKRNGSVMETFKYSFSIDFAVNMSIRCSERATQPETIFFSVDFLVIMIYQNFLFVYMQKYSFYLYYSPSVFTHFIIFILLPFSIIFKFNFGLNFNTVRLFYLNLKISFGFLPIKEKSLGLLDLASKM